MRFLDVDKRPERAALAAAHKGQTVISAGDTCTDIVPGIITGSPRGVRAEAIGRRPVVVLLGHFNHGKTTILDALLGPDSGIAK